MTHIIFSDLDHTRAKRNLEKSQKIEKSLRDIVIQVQIASRIGHVTGSDRGHIQNDPNHVIVWNQHVIGPENENIVQDQTIVGEINEIEEIQDQIEIDRMIREKDLTIVEEHRARRKRKFMTSWWRHYDVIVLRHLFSPQLSAEELAKQRADLAQRNREKFRLYASGELDKALMVSHFVILVSHNLWVNGSNLKWPVNDLI